MLEGDDNEQPRRHNDQNIMLLLLMDGGGKEMENSKAEVRFTWAQKKLPIGTLLSVSNVVLIGKRGGEIRFHAHGNRVYGALQFTPSHSYKERSQCCRGHERRRRRRNVV